MAGPDDASRSRRVDWWSLLPARGSTGDVAILGDPPAAALVGRALIEHGRCRQVVTGLGEAALVVVLGSWQGDLGAVVRSAPEDALIYVEASRSWRAIAPLVRARRELALAGAMTVASYWASPSILSPRRFFPVHAPAAMRWHVRTHFVASSLPLLIARTVLGIIGRLPPTVMEHCAGSGAIIASRSRSRASAPELLVDAAGRVPSVAELGPDPHCLLVTSGNDLGSRCVLYAFGQGDSAPSVVVKQSAAPRFNESTRRENERLADLGQRLADASSAAPRPLGAFSHHGLEVSVESVAPGRTLASFAGDVGVRSRTLVDQLHMVVETVRDMAIALAPAPCASGEDDQRWADVVVGPVAALRNVSSTRPTLSAVVAEIERRLLALERRPSLVEQHFDLGPWNIYVDGGAVTVIDWESDPVREPFRVGMPGCDVAYLVQYWYFASERTDGLDEESDAIGRLVDALAAGGDNDESELVALICRSMGDGATASDAALAILVMWCERAWYHLTRVGDTAGVAWAPSYVQWLEHFGWQLLDIGVGLMSHVGEHVSAYEAASFEVDDLRGESRNTANI